jgi:hypothetical protein
VPGRDAVSRPHANERHMYLFRDDDLAFGIRRVESFRPDHTSEHEIAPRIDWRGERLFQVQPTLQ